jgi:hypothetical protein
LKTVNNYMKKTESSDDAKIKDVSA